MSSFDILAKERPLEPRLFLEASAGTGKTFTIEHLVVRLLQETSVTLEQILVVTFTRAATRELKERIRANLDKSVQFDKAQIFTIHGFCQRLLQEFAFEASVGLELSEWTPEEETWAILEFLRQTTCVSPQQLRRLLGKYQNEMQVVVQKLKRSTSKQEIDIIAAINRELATLSFFPLAELFAKIRSEYKGMTSLDFGPQAELLQEVLRRQHLTPQEFDRLIGEDDLFLENLTESQLKVRAKISHPLQLKEFRDRLWPLLEKARDPYPIFQIVANGWHQEKKRLARLHEKISPDDLLEMVQERLSDPAFVKRVREKYQVVIVDEFQDTDPIQWNIFNKLFIQDAAKSIYLVGDPKQSIYAFRKADIYTFLQAGELFAKKAELTTNYRSGPQLISALNRLFCSKPWLDLPKLGQTLVAQPVQAAKKEGGELCFMVTEGHIGRSKQWPTKEIE
ncbi:MAG TPA: UvrD-helicase domain-containing protein, partial [Rhabdochlamydiaceae bacterium]|nr:UvrD-helicase domain-containing protein [Rhabdochlamydiaceae bacterium]